MDTYLKELMDRIFQRPLLLLVLYRRRVYKRTRLNAGETTQMNIRRSFSTVVERTVICCFVVRSAWA